MVDAKYNVGGRKVKSILIKGVGPKYVPSNMNGIYRSIRPREKTVKIPAIVFFAVTNSDRNVMGHIAYHG